MDPTDPKQADQLHQSAVELQRKLLARPKFSPESRHEKQTKQADPHLTTRLADFAQDVWTRVLLSPECQFCYDEHSAVDVLFRALFFGWDEALGVHDEHCRHWLALRDIDTTIFVPCGMEICARFGCLYLTFLWATQLAGNPAKPGVRPVPHWLRPRPTQTQFAHNRAIDTIIWPGLREHLVLKSPQGPSDAFYAAYATSTRFYWPHPLTSAFTYHQPSLQYRLTPDMLATLADMCHWRMDQAFLDGFPRHENDVPTLSSLPSCILLWRGRAGDIGPIGGNAGSTAPTFKTADDAASDGVSDGDPESGARASAGVASSRSLVSDLARMPPPPLPVGSRRAADEQGEREGAGPG